jgi:mannosyltransferase OCH1-like enzyme
MYNDEAGLTSIVYDDDVVYDNDVWWGSAVPILNSIISTSEIKTIVEDGSGFHSTRYLHSSGKNVHTIEGNPKWLKTCKSKWPENAKHKYHHIRLPVEIKDISDRWKDLSFNGQKQISNWYYNFGKRVDGELLFIDGFSATRFPCFEELARNFPFVVLHDTEFELHESYNINEIYNSIPDGYNHYHIITNRIWSDVFVRKEWDNDLWKEEYLECWKNYGLDSYSKIKIGIEEVNPKKEEVIPKIIHYCWFGKGRKNKTIRKCISSWKKYLPDYEIREWNESNFDVNSSPYTKQMYKNKLWAFVSDYVRFLKLYEYGGIYLDTDVEVLKSLDEFLKYECFVGYEGSGFIGSAIVGSKIDHWFIKKCMTYYNNDGEWELTSPQNMTMVLRKSGNSGVKVYPVEYFYPFSYTDHYCKECIKQKTHAIHWWQASWQQKSENNLYNKIIKKITKGLYRYYLKWE